MKNVDVQVSPILDDREAPTEQLWKPHGAVKDTQLSPILDDQPAARDYLDFDSYVQALKELIVHGSTKTPLTLGIFGRWGTGKTTLMRMLERELKNAGIATVWFNAWQYGNEDELWAAFLQSIFNKMQADLGLFRQLSFKLKLLLKRIEWHDAPGLVLKYLFRILLALIPLLIIDPVSQDIQPSARPLLQAGGSMLSMALAVWIVAKPIVDAVQQNVSIDLSTFRQTSNYQEHIAFLDKFREHFADVVQSLPQRGDKRLAVFIDDLDRCSPERTLQVLDAIKVFVDIQGCVYILGLDVDVVQKAIATKYQGDPVAQREYLGKIVQLPFQLPPLTREEMQEYLERLALDLPHQRCHEVFVAGLVVNPREIKRTINVFSLLWNLAAKREELAGLIAPVRLAKVVVIQHSHPDLHRLLQQHPHLLIELEQYFRKTQETETAQADAPQTSGPEGEEEIEETPLDISPELQPYATSEALRRMLLLHELPDSADETLDDEYSFAHLAPEDVAVYFTLTSRAEAPAAVVPEEPAAAVPGAPSSILTELAPGQSFGDRYRIIGEVGQGGTAFVYVAQDQVRGHRVALKVLRPMLNTEQGAAERFHQEISALYRLDHPNLVRVYDSGEEFGLLYYAMEYLAGGNLKARIAQGPLAPQATAEWALPIIDAVAYMHREGIMHRDIKPSSIMFDAREVPKLSDLGVARALERPSEITQTGAIVGTPAYMSPEQIQGVEVDVRSDLYSFGIVLYESLAGRAPFTGDSPVAFLYKQINEPPPPLHTFNPDVPAALEQVVMKLLEKEPAKRYQTAGEVKAALREELELVGRVCPSCGFSNRPEAVFCGSCGAPLPSVADLLRASGLMVAH